MGIGDGGLGIGPNPQSPIPNPQSPIPNPHVKNFFFEYINFILFKFKKYLIINNNIKLKNYEVESQYIFLYLSSRD